MPGVSGNLLVRKVGPARLVAAAALSLAAVGCGEGEPTVVPIAAVPLGAPGGQCVDVFAEAFEGAGAQVCLYFQDAPCVLVADIGAAETEGCAGDGQCSLAADSWMKYCPEGAPDYDTETEAGQQVPASLYVVAGAAMSGERPSFCTFEAPGACNGSSDPDQGTTGCLARIDLTYRVNETTGAFEPDQSVAPALSYSGFALEEMGMWSSAEAVCPSIEAESCPPEAASCSPVDLELLLQGSAGGRVRAEPRGTTCADPRCVESYPRGRTVTISATADDGAVLAELGSALGAGDGCVDLFTETTTTATCAVTLDGDGQVTVDFGYALTVGVNGEGQITGSPGGIDGDGIDCSNGACTEIYSEDVAVTLTANQTQADWQFSNWMGGPCDGDRAPTCTVQMDQAHTVNALFGFALDLEVVGDGAITATPPGQTCDGASSPCVVTYRKDDVTTLTVTPGSGSVFEGWGGACEAEGSNPTCTVTMDAEKAVTARFAYEVQSRVEGGGAVERVPPGGACATLGAALCGSYLPGSPVSFVATPDTDWVFLDWTGCSATPGTTQCDATVEQAVTVRGRFGRELSFSSAGSGTVDITGPVHGDCGPGVNGTCTGAYPDGATVTLTASPDAGWAVQASSWAGCTPVAGDPSQCTVTMSGAVAVQLTFGRRLDVTAGPGGRVSSAPAGIDCGADCAEVFEDGTGVTLTAAPDAGWAFEAWTGCTPDNQDPAVCTVSMDAARSVSASFGRTLSVSVVGGGVVQSTPAGIACSDSGGACAQTFGDGSSVTLDATPAAGWAFLGWTGCTPDVAIPTRCTSNLSAARSVTATFGRQLSVSTVGTGVVALQGSTGLSCPSDCDEVIADGTQVNLRATAASGWALVGFTGCDSVSGDTCTVTMNQARTVSATFGRDLVVTISGLGTVTSNPAGISCFPPSGDCDEPYTQGSVVTLDATPNSGWSFLGWSGCTPDGVIPTRCSVTMSAARTVTASFGRQLDVAVVGNGTVTSNPAGINCGADCTEVYPGGTSVVLTATPVAPAQFGGWTGCPSENGNQCTVSMNQARAVTASFGAGVTVLIAEGQGTVQSTPPGISCPGDCNEVYNNNQNVRLDATPAPGWVVLSWTGCTPDAGNPNRCTLTATGGGQAVAVRFGRQLDVAVTGNGTVRSSPPGIVCGADCDEVYSNGTAVTLTATPNAGWAFLSWTGCTPVTGSPEQCTTTMNQARSVAATFGRQLDVTINGGGAVSSNPVGVSCGPGCTVFDANTVVTLTASPNAGWALQGWSGCTPQANPLQCVVTMSAARAVTVDFGRQLDVTVVGPGTVTSNPAGINCGADCREVFDDGQNVTLTAAPSAGRDLASWSGCTPVGGNPLQCTTTMSAARAVTATFQPILTVNAPTAIAGETVVSNPAGLSCVGPACSASADFPPGSSVVLTASPGAGRAVSWTGCTVGGNPNQCTVTMNGPQTVTVTFSPTLTVTSANQLAGETITSNPAGISCAGASCSATAPFAAGTNITLTASPQAGRQASWTGCTPGGNPNQCTLTLNTPVTVTVTYQPILTVDAPTAEAGESITSNPAGITCSGAACSDAAAFASGTTITLTAAPNGGRTVTWTNCTPQANPDVCTLTLNAATTVTATFNDPAPQRTLTVSSASSIAGESVTSSPAGINCSGANCSDSAQFVQGTAVTLTASPGTNRTVAQWTGCTVNGANPLECDVTMNANTTVTVDFVDTYTLDVTFAGAGTGRVDFSLAALGGETTCNADCTVTYMDGDVVDVTAVPDGGSTFNSFSGDCTGGTCSVTMSQNRAITATFD